MPDGPILSFGPYHLDLTKEQLWWDSQPVRLPPKAFQVLCYVVTRPGQLVTKEELFQAIWTDTVVGDAALSVCVQELRKVLQDNAKTPQYLETVPRRGFRFIAAVVRSEEAEFKSQNVEGRIQEEENHKPVLSPSTSLRIHSVEETNSKNPEQAEGVMRDASEPPPSSPSRLEPAVDSFPRDFDTPVPNTQPPAPPPPAVSRLWPSRAFVLAAVLLLAATILTVQYLSRLSLSTQSSALITQEAQLPLPDKPSLIVLPLVNLSNDPEQEYFSDGLTEELTGDLSKISSLFIIAHNSALTYKNKAAKVQDISREMGVRYVLEGSVQRAKQRLRIAVQLIDATTGYQIWSQQYDRPLTDIFAVQDEIVQQIVTTLKLQLTLEEQGWKVRKRTDNVEAYNTFLRGKAYYWLYTKESNAQARQLFEKAVTLDPQYAEAYAELGETYLLAWSVRWSTDLQVLEQALTLEQQALALDDSLPIAHSLLGGVYSQHQQYDQAIAEGKRAITLDPNNADIYSNLAVDLNFAGRPAEALQAVEQAIRLNPHAPPPYLAQLGVANNLIGRYTEAIAALQALINRSPNFPFAHNQLASSYLLQWLTQESPTDQTLALAKAEVQRALALDDSWPGNHIILGYIYLCQRQYDQALAEMERAVSLAPNDAGSYAALAVVLSYIGETNKALEAAAQALQLKPLVPDSHLADVGTVYAVAGHYEEARAALQRFLSHYPNHLLPHLVLASVYSQLGQAAEARAEAEEVLRLNPHFSLAVLKQRASIKDPEKVERAIAALRKAGLK